MRLCPAVLLAVLACSGKSVAQPVSPGLAKEASLAQLVPVLPPVIPIPRLCTDNKISSPVNINVGEIRVPWNASVGTVLKTDTSVASDLVVTCPTVLAAHHITRAEGQWGTKETMVVRDRQGNIIPGLGVRISGNVRYPSTPLLGFCQTRSDRILASDDFKGEMRCRLSFPEGEADLVRTSYRFSTITLTFVKTAETLRSAWIGTTNLLSMQINPDPASSYHPVIQYRISGGFVDANACELIVPKAVDLGTTSISQLESGSSPVTPFRVGLRCRENISARVRVSAVGGSRAVEGQTGAITNAATGSASAKGVHVQLMNADHAPVDIGVDMPYRGGGNSAELNFAARMVQASGQQVQAGQVRATAIFTVSPP